MSSIISVENLKKNYGKVEAVKGIDFFVESGKLFAFLGPNGAGKSTTIDVLCTLLTPDAGAVIIDNHILGKHNDAIRKKIGIVFQDSLLDPLLTVRENLTTRARFYGLSGSSLKNAVNTAAITADITDFLDRPYGKLSGGQRRRTDIARALLNTPKILFLDEPTTGLDPKSKDSLWNTIKTLQKDTGMTIFLTTHYMEEAAAADYIIILNHGKIAAKGTPYDLREKYSYDTLRIKPKDAGHISAVLGNAGMSFSNSNGIIIAKLSKTLDAIPIIKTLENDIESFEVIHGSMDDVFLQITVGELNNA